MRNKAAHSSGESEAGRDARKKENLHRMENASASRPLHGDGRPLDKFWGRGDRMNNGKDGDGAGFQRFVQTCERAPPARVTRDLDEDRTGLGARGRFRITW